LNWPATSRPRLDKTVLSASRPVRRCGVNLIPDNSRLSPTENLKPEHVNSNCPIHTATPDTTQTGLFCRVWCGGVSRRCVLCLVCVGMRPAAQCDRRTHSDAERTCPAINSHRHTRKRQDCSACLSAAAAAMQARRAATLYVTQNVNTPCTAAYD